MRDYTLTHLSDAKLLRELTALVSRDRETTALVLAHIAEVDARRAYAGAGYPSLFAYCVEALRYSEDASYKRIQAARAARLYPVLFEAVAEGRLHLAAVCLLAPHLNPENAEELMRAATHRTKGDLEGWLAARFPGCGSPGVVCSITALAPVGHGGQASVELAPGQVAQAGVAADELALAQVAVVGMEAGELAPGQVAVAGAEARELAPGQVAAPPVEAERYLVRVTIGRGTHEKLRYAQALLSHAVPSGDVAQVLDRALEALIARLERRKLGAARRAKRAIKARPAAAGSSPRLRRTVAAGSSRAPRRTATRYVPAPVRRAVWERDGGRCTFVGEGGKRCHSRHFLEFDHAEPFARGGAATVEGLRLRCRAHNQYEAERVFGAEFMRAKRNGARLARRNAAARRSALAESEAADQPAAARKEEAKDLEAALRGLGCRAGEARHAARHAMAIEGATFDDRLRAALTFRPRRTPAWPALTDACEVRERRMRYGQRAWEWSYPGNRRASAEIATVSSMKMAKVASASCSAWWTAVARSGTW